MKHFLKKKSEMVLEICTDVLKDSGECLPKAFIFAGNDNIIVPLDLSDETAVLESREKVATIVEETGAEGFITVQDTLRVHQESGKRALIGEGLWLLCESKDERILIWQEYYRDESNQIKLGPKWMESNTGWNHFLSGILCKSHEPELDGGTDQEPEFPAGSLPS